MLSAEGQIRWSVVGLAALVGAVVVVMSFGQPTPASANHGPDRVCGVTPGTGYYNYIAVWDVKCQRARRVSRKAGKKFCGDRYQYCRGEPGDYFSGRVKLRRWTCKMRVGWEYYRARCNRGDDKRFLHKSAA